MSRPNSEPRGPSYRDEIAYGEHVIIFDVVRAKRTTLGIHVYPSGDVEVRAPLDAQASDVRARVHRRAGWIVRHQRRFSELVQSRPPKEYLNGETHRYLGRQYRLKVVPSADHRENGVRLVGRYFEVRTSQPDEPSHTQDLLERWYRRRADVRLRERFKQGCVVMERYGIAQPPLGIRSMDKRWGSCTASGRILLNPRLVLAPTSCIDYVVIHELCHLRHPHHGRIFYDLLSRAMPDWEARQAALRSVQ